MVRRIYTRYISDLCDNIVGAPKTSIRIIRKPDSSLTENSRFYTILSWEGMNECMNEQDTNYFCPFDRIHFIQRIGRQVGDAAVKPRREGDERDLEILPRNSEKESERLISKVDQNLAPYLSYYTHWHC